MKQIQCEVCGSREVIKSGKLFVCKSCGCRYLPDSYYEDEYLQTEESPTIDEVLSHKGINPVRVQRDSYGIKIIDEYSGIVYTVEEYKKHLYSLTHKTSRIKEGLKDAFNALRNKNINFTVITYIALTIVILLFIILGILSIRDRRDFWSVFYQFFIAGSAGLTLGFLVEYDGYLPLLAAFDLLIQISLGHFVIFGTWFNLEWFWRLLIGVVLWIANGAIMTAIFEHDRQVHWNERRWKKWGY